jgi:hypothetical protein
LEMGEAAEPERAAAQDSDTPQLGLKIGDK